MQAEAPGFRVAFARRPRVARVVALGMVLLALSGLAPGATPAGARTPDRASARHARPAGTDCTPGWAEDHRTPTAILEGVRFVGGRAWAAGMTTGAGRRSVLLRDTASGWVPVRLPHANVETGLMALDRAPNGTVWAAGYRRSGRIHVPLVLRGDAAGMRAVALPAAAPRGAALQAVTVLDGSVLAAGFEVGARGERPLLLTGRAGRWTWSRPSLGSSRSGALLAVAGVARGPAFAAGWRQSATGAAPYLVERTASGWRAVPATLRPTGDGAILDLVVTAQDRAWAVGYDRSTGPMRPLAWRWDGAAWTALPTFRDGAPMTLLTGVAATTDGIVASGATWETATGTWSAIVARWNGSGWSVSSPVTPPTIVLRDLATRPSGGATTLVGATRASGVVLDWCPGAAPGPAARRPHRARRPDGTRPRAAAHPRAARPRSARDAMALDPGAGPLVATDQAAAAGLFEVTFTTGGAVADLDDNGWPDLFVPRHAGRALLALNTAGRFVPPEGAPFPQRDRHDCAIADANDDDRLDVYCTLGATGGAGLKANELWTRQADGSYLDRGAWTGAADPLGRGRTVTFFDLDHDAWPDLFLGNESPRVDGEPSQNVVLVRPGGGDYRPASTQGFDPSSGIRCLHPVDLDEDGWEDLLACRRNPDRRDGFGVTWLRNEQGVLRDRTTALGIAQDVTADLLPVDVDLDTHLDLVEVTPTALVVHLARPGGWVPAGHVRLSHGWSVAAGDVDGDGDPDLYVVQGTEEVNTPDRLYLVSAGGRTLTPFPIPTTTEGAPDQALPIDHDGNGLTDFVVLNGGQRPGPIQLIAFSRVEVQPAVP